MTIPISNDVAALFERLLSERERYSNDEIPIGAFLVAFNRFYAAATVARSRRFADALRFFSEFYARRGELEENEDAPGMWRAFDNGVLTVRRYDRAKAARVAPPSRSIDELIALGVSRAQIATIYGFRRPDGSPDVDAVERRDAWKPPKNVETDERNDPETAKELARLAVDALQKLEAGGEPIDSETIAELEELAATPSPESKEEPTREPTDEEIDAAINREILDGVPTRQIAARYGIDADEVRKRADALQVVASESAEELPPRLVKEIEARRGELDAGKTYRQIARAVSSAERRVTEADVRRVLGAR